jgi:acyl-ACP thioesterase
MDYIYKTSYKIRSYEIDFKGKAQLYALLNYFQDAAGEHAAKLGFSIKDLFAKRMTWVLSRYHIRILRYPLWGETVQVITWPSGRKDLFALRDFELLDREGNVIAEATTSWIMLNLKNKQPVPLKEFLPVYPVKKGRIIKHEFEPLPDLTQKDREVFFRVQQKDLDLNKHVNNTVYIQWAVESIPPDMLDKYKPVEIEVSYRGEAFYGDEIAAEVQVLQKKEPQCLLHKIVNKANRTDLTRLRTFWK